MTVAAQRSDRRLGDAIAIPGDYQHRARTHGMVIQRFWHAEKERMIRQYCAPRAGERVLDVGCGSGVISDVLASYGALVTGIDGNAAAIEYAAGTFVRRNLEFRQGYVDEDAAPPGTIDRIYCFEVVEHLYEAQVTRLVASFARLLKPGGVVCLTTPNFRGVWPALEWLLDRLRLVPALAEEQHVSRFDPRSLRAQFSGPSWRVVRQTTFCTVAPFASVLGWGFAEAIASREGEWNLPIGSLLFVVAERQ